MQGARKHVLRVVVAATIAASVSACSLKMARIGRVLRTYEDVLRLDVALVDSSPVAPTTIDLRLTLLNVSTTETVRACLGYTRDYVLMADPIEPGRKPLDEDVRTVDHPYCDRRFELGPGEKLEWIDRANVNIGSGTGRLFASVSIVHPRDCDRYGCYDTQIKAPELRLTVR